MKEIEDAARPIMASERPWHYNGAGSIFDQESNVVIHENGFVNEDDKELVVTAVNNYDANEEKIKNLVAGLTNCEIILSKLATEDEGGVDPKYYIALMQVRALLKEAE